MRTNSDMSERLSRLEHKIHAVAHANKLQSEQVREDIKRLGDDYNASVRRLSKQIEQLDARWAGATSGEVLAPLEPSEGTVVWNLREESS